MALFEQCKMAKMKQHEMYIKMCYELAKQAVADGNHPFGALLLVGTEVVLTQKNQVNTSGDNTQHAELELVRSAANQLSEDDLQRAILYTSTEPCAMCAGAIYWSGISSLVYGCSAASLGRITGGSLVIPCRDVLSKGARSVKVIGPMLETEGRQIHRSYW